jgi:hypothetical protein
MVGRRRCKPFTTKDTKVHEGRHRLVRARMDAEE